MYQHHIVHAPAGVEARKGPGTNFPIVHTIPNDSPIEIVCQVHGDCRECTSFVAWRLRQHGIDFTNGLKGGWFGNAMTLSTSFDSRKRLTPGTNRFNKGRS
jgi:hypothetical protein